MGVFVRKFGPLLIEIECDKSMEVVSSIASEADCVFRSVPTCCLW